MRQYILVSSEGGVYRGPDGMPINRSDRISLRRLAKREGLTDFKTTEVSWVELRELQRRCLRTMQPVTFAKVIGI